MVEVTQQYINIVIEGTKQFIDSITNSKSSEIVRSNIANVLIKLTERQCYTLRNIIKRSTAPQRLVIRSKIILALGRRRNIMQITRTLGIKRKTIYKWLYRWVKGEPSLKALEEKRCKDKELSNLIENILDDDYRSGTPSKFTPEQIVKIIALACENIERYRLPLSHWTSKVLAEEAVKRSIVENISPRTVRRLLKEASIKPHLSRYWLNAVHEDEEQFNKDVKEICELYKKALELHKEGIHIMSTDEKTGIQALEHKYPSKPVGPGLVELIEHEYERHGTICLIANFEVATGQIVKATLVPTRKEEDFLNHIINTVKSDPSGKWIFIVDNLNTHMSASLVEWIALQCNIAINVGSKKESVLKSMETRAAFLSDPTHQIRFVYTPKHASWLNQIEIWFSILVRRLLKRSSFESVNELCKRIDDFIDYFNNTMAKPFKWTYGGKPLSV